MSHCCTFTTSNYQC